MDTNTDRATFLRGQLAAREIDLLSSYRADGATIWDATELHKTVFRLLELGLIYHDDSDASSWAYRLTPLGAAVQGEGN